MSAEKFLIFYGWVIALGGAGGIGAIWAGVKMNRRLKLERAAQAQQKRLANARYGGRDPDENAILLEETAGLLEDVVDMMNEADIATLLEVADRTSSSDIYGTKQRIADHLAKLAREDVKAYRPERLRRRDHRDEQTRHHGA